MRNETMEEGVTKVDVNLSGETLGVYVVMIVNTNSVQYAKKNVLQ
ncbi:MAG: hypothetical protein ACXVNO_02165 [Bacteroidia bacterium]